MRILAMDASLARCSVALVRDGVAVVSRQAVSGRGQSAALSSMLSDILGDAAGFDVVAVTVGPGSFTGLRTALALAHGLATSGARLVPVTVAEALAEAAGPEPGRVLWTAIDSRRGRIFLDTGDALRATWLDRLPLPPGAIAVTGDAAIEVAARLAARGNDVRLTDARLPHASHVAAAARRRLAGELPPLGAEPIYVDPPEARLPAGGLRPEPHG